ncbi:MAG TPA: sugar transferase [Hyphomicrobium sp.]|nr:sugar transferase [Hyphomicrobium sp.]
MSVVSPRDYSSVSRPNGGTEARLLPTTLALPEALGYGDAEGEASVTRARRNLWALYSADGRPEKIRPVGGLSKRVFDVVIASAALFLLAPLLLALAGAIKLLNGGDVIYRHRRVGFSGKYFSCLKFRTMVPNGDEVLRRHLDTNPAAAEEWRRTRKLSRDPRITLLGYFLRKTSLDELPQLINILRGEMSCVGPRPIVADELHFYGDYAVDYFRARPGVTGLWQVSGRSLATYEERVNYDLQYVRDWTLMADFLILARTIPAVLNTRQAA